MVENLLSYLVLGFGFAISGFFSALGQAVNEIYFKPWLKRLKRKHKRLVKKLADKVVFS